jgi:hypothetical protein
MTQNIITAGDASTPGLQVQGGGNDGTLVLQSGPAGAKVNALTIDAAGNVKTAANAAPAFNAKNTTQSVPNAAYTKLGFGTITFDTAGCYNNTGAAVGGVPAYAFLPTVAGYYSVTTFVGYSVASTNLIVSIYKNGSSIVTGVQGSLYATIATELVFMNGTTDYLEVYSYQNSGAPATASANFKAFLARSA